MRVQEHARSSQLRNSGKKNASDRLKSESHLQMREQYDESAGSHIARIKHAGEMHGGASADAEDVTAPKTAAATPDEGAGGDGGARGRTLAASEPPDSRPRRRRRLLNRAALDKMSAVKRQATGRGGAVAAERRSPPPPPPPFADRVAHERTLLSLREKVSSYADCAPLDDDEEDGTTNMDGMCSKDTVHVSMGIDARYIRGATALINSILKNASCPQHVFFHFLTASESSSSRDGGRRGSSERDDGDSGVGDGVDEYAEREDGGLDDPMGIVRYYFPFIRYKAYSIDEDTLREHVRKMDKRPDDLEHPLNYSRIVLPLIVPECVEKVIYLDTDMVVVGRIEELFAYVPGDRVIGSPEHCDERRKARHYFTDAFWGKQEGGDAGSTHGGAAAVARRDPEDVFGKVGRRACYFNPGVLVIDVLQWKERDISNKLLGWMSLHRASSEPLYELGSLPPFLLVFAGRIGAGAEHSSALDRSWNDHDYGCVCHDHPDARTVNIVHWSCGT